MLSVAVISQKGGAGKTAPLVNLRIGDGPYVVQSPLKAVYHRRLGGRLRGWCGSSGAPADVSFNEAAGHSRRIKTSPPLSHVQSTGYFNEAASRGQRIRTNQIRADLLLQAASRIHDRRPGGRFARFREYTITPPRPGKTPYRQSSKPFSGGRPRSGRISPRSARTVGRSLPRPAPATCSRGPRPDA